MPSQKPENEEGRKDSAIANVQTIVGAGLGISILVIMQAVEKGADSASLATGAGFAMTAVGPLSLGYMSITMHREDADYSPRKSVILIYLGMVCVWIALLCLTAHLSWTAAVSGFAAMLLSGVVWIAKGRHDSGEVNERP